ncbi:ST3 beta-galactoside alpha-2,3-sialyltransferase 7 [Chanos chanos]|uniref:Lactosylceramide alpha-2,3-sialyltransferase n=1 Tax=Chanos chanos TaxID=29144 RepID=A0A6J2V3Y6_CHACN|nr:lactosylceramide alpha-2,3-sialyltransferase-like [Chanos chanos]XP_030626493.1 lactosylceramide alpha-2,3-sialyltransferase-like [Chanos chanos]
MVHLKGLFVNDHEEGSTPLLPEAESYSFQHRRAESREIFLGRGKNLVLSIFLLLGSYSAILIPAYLPTTQPNWANESFSEEAKALLNQSAVLLSRVCQPQWTRDRLQRLAALSDLQEIPVFLQNGNEDEELPPPMGLQGTGEMVNRTLSTLPKTSLPSTPETCRRCVVVGSGGILHSKHLGAHIDRYNIIIRMNNAPVKGFERDAGSRTTIRLIYPEGAPHSPWEYHNTEIAALVAFKGLDFEWLTSVVTKEPLSWWSKLWFWKNVIDTIPLKAENFRILNPKIVYKTRLVLQSYVKQQRTIIPTLGATAVVLALQLCDEVSLAGFGYDMQHPGALLHYYGTLRMDTMMTQVVHDVSAETLFLRQLVTEGVVHDLTGGICQGAKCE